MTLIPLLKQIRLDSQQSTIKLSVLATIRPHDTDYSMINFIYRHTWEFARCPPSLGHQRLICERSYDMSERLALMDHLISAAHLEEMQLAAAKSAICQGQTLIKPLYITQRLVTDWLRTGTGSLIDFCQE